MIETDIDTQTETDLPEQETEARLPWESIDPEEVPATYASPFASTAIAAVEAEAAASDANPLAFPILLDRFARLEAEAASVMSEDEREEQLADRAFFSDEKISIESLAVPEPAAPVVVDAVAVEPALLTPAFFSEQNLPVETPVLESVQQSAVIADGVLEVTPDVQETHYSTLSVPNAAIATTTVTVADSDSLIDVAPQPPTLYDVFVDDEPQSADDRAFHVTSEATDGFAGLASALPPSIEPPQPAEIEIDLEPELPVATATTGGGWSIPLMCLGIGLIACCMVIPQGEANRRLRYEQVSLAADYRQVEKQVSVNNEFLEKVSDDPTLAERLAGRQMKTIRKGQKVVEMKDKSEDGDMSPFSLVAVAKPADLPPYHPRRSTIANLCNNDRSRLYLLGSAMGMVAMGLVMGFGGVPKSEIRMSKSETNSN